MTDTERQELYTLMQQWGRNDDILYQKVREWVEAKLDALQSERDALREALTSIVNTRNEIRSDYRLMVKMYEIADAALSTQASGEPARKP